MEGGYNPRVPLASVPIARTGASHGPGYAAAGMDPDTRYGPGYAVWNEQYRA